MSIRILNESVARKIAAGEVIDRPHSVVRELIDNSIDANASKIEIHIEDGGRQSIRVTDNGDGMTAEDLRLCTLSHATSKIEHEDDLLKVNSLGFRGEALSSIAAVSRLSIRSKPSGSETGNQLRCTLGEPVVVNPSPSQSGTSVEIRELFFNLPARRHFVKSASAETNLIKRTITDKAAAYPRISFQLYIDSRPDLMLLPGSRLDRIVQLYPKIAPREMWYKAEGTAEGFRISVFAVRPDIYRRDRRYLQAFVNTRRVNEYALQQAVEYAYSDYIPGGNFPISFVFIDIDPALVDFNIHPAKKEIRFRNRETVHHKLVSTVQSALKSYALSVRKTVQPIFPSYDLDFPAVETLTTAEQATRPIGLTPKPNTAFTSRIQQAGDHSSPDTIRQNTPDSQSTAVPSFNLQNRFTPSGELSRRLNTDRLPDGQEYHYFGQLFRLFLLVEYDERFFIIDMHAGHERLQYDLLKEENSSQQLMIPLGFSVDEGQSEYLTTHMSELKELGIEIRKISYENWELITVPARFTGDPHKLIPFLCGKSGHSSQLSVFLYATIACKSAVKDGDLISDDQAHAIIRGVFQLPDARCPHGRPIWIEFDKESLFSMVGRE
ncbi:DNA mismatch repair endonuclease MutL [Spirochaeta dissipatitropha]